MKKINSLIIAAASLPLAAFGQFTFTSIGQTYSENFNDYRGSSATLPDHMFVSWDTTRSGMSGPESPYQGVNTGAFTAYTNADEIDYSFGIRERNPVDLRDARLFFEFTNNTGVAITGFDVSYDVEAWFIGERRNRIRLKYDDHLTSATAPGGRATFETDIFSTDNPSTETAFNTIVDGSLADNRTTVTGFVDLTTLDDGTGNFFGSLAPGETAYFRWQFSNLETGEGTGNPRSGLAINNLEITAVPEPETYAAIFGFLALAGVIIRRRFVRNS